MASAVDPQVWRACAGSAAWIPAVGATVIYFPEGHAENCSPPPDLSSRDRWPSSFTCTVLAVDFLAILDDDEVFVRMTLQPVTPQHRIQPAPSPIPQPPQGVLQPAPPPVPRTPEDLLQPAPSPTRQMPRRETPPDLVYDAKRLSSSAFSTNYKMKVPWFCYTYLFPRIDAGTKQHLSFIDVHGNAWPIIHSHTQAGLQILGSGWKTFTDAKHLAPDDTVIFIKNPISDLLFIGIWRAEPSGHVTPEDFIQAIELAEQNLPFKIDSNPRSRAQVYVVSDHIVMEAAAKEDLPPGTAFTLPMEVYNMGPAACQKECLGEVAGVSPEHPKWPDSKWRRMKVIWIDPVPEPLRDIKCINAWQVSNVGRLHDDVVQGIEIALTL